MRISRKLPRCTSLEVDRPLLACSSAVPPMVLTPMRSSSKLYEIVSFML